MEYWVLMLRIFYGSVSSLFGPHVANGGHLSTFPSFGGGAEANGRRGSVR